MIQLEYRDGSKRIIHPHVTFYKGKDHKLSDSEMINKVVHLANQFGSGLYQAIVFLGSKNILTHTNKNNAPEKNKNLPPVVLRNNRIERHKLIKRLKKELKNPSFSMVSKNGVTYSLPLNK